MRPRLGTVRYAAFALVFFVLYLLSETPGMLPAVYDVRPVPLIAAAVTVAMLETEVAGMAFGIYAGVLIDFGMGTVMGFHAGALAVLCFAASWLCRNLLRVNLLSCAVLTLAASAVLLLLQWVFFHWLAGDVGAAHVLVRYTLPRAFYSSLFCLLTYPLCRAVFNATGGGGLQA